MSRLRALAKRYARGLAESAPKQLGQIASALDGWQETARQSPDLEPVLADPKIPKSARADLAGEFFAKLDAPAVLLNLARLLIEENRFSLLNSIQTEFIEEKEKREGTQRVVVETPNPLAEPVRERIRSRLAEVLRRHVLIVERVNSHILGGVNLQIGSRVWYGSVRHRVEQSFR